MRPRRPHDNTKEEGPATLHIVIASTRQGRAGLPTGQFDELQRVEGALRPLRRELASPAEAR
jgi:hypothetical protein